MARPDRRDVSLDAVRRALIEPTITREQADGRVRHWVWVEETGRWLRVIVEADGETVHNAFWDRNFRP